MIWLLAERQSLLPDSIESTYSKEQLIAMARKWQESFRHLARPSRNHDQGFRFQLSFGRDYEMTGSEDAKGVMIEASESLIDRYSPEVCVAPLQGCLNARAHSSQSAGCHQELGPRPSWSECRQRT